MKKGSRYFVQGAIELLDAPGEFYLDKAAGYLYYYARDGAISSQEIIAPKVDKVILFHGSTNTTRVHNIQLDGLTVMVSNSTYADLNGGNTGNIDLINAEDITIKNSQINLASASNGISMPPNDGQPSPVKSRVIDNLIYGNYFHDVGDSGVRITGIANTSDYTHMNNVVSNNWIDDIARIATNGAGIYFANAAYAEASYNKVTNAVHYGIQVKGQQMDGSAGHHRGHHGHPAKSVQFQSGPVQLEQIQRHLQGQPRYAGHRHSEDRRSRIRDARNNRLYDSGRFGLQKGLYLA
ncbi:right-handed parallel beta-helix repeat-containing protein [Paenibacillus koleovorans]|uniref:right-handed parallel beta-helix repeat-containing protein n=1 Tax=Paenibacillus koleovorans TaxID=121608 RepID=UPI000FD7DC14|nr:right-handed parallel beta-helix repeat-containing protein [Paenibacillus koleovorans]